MQRNATLEDVTGQRYWQIADYHHVYSQRAVTPVDVIKNVIAAVKHTRDRDPVMNLLVTMDELDMAKLAAQSSDRSALQCPDEMAARQVV